MTRLAGRPTGTPRTRGDAGFALVAVLWVVTVVSLVSMELVSAMGSEARMARNRADSLQAARLAAAGHEVAEYLRRSGLLVEGAALDAIPVSTIVVGRYYRVAFSKGTAEIRFESDNGKYSLVSSGVAELTRAFSLWRNDSASGERMARAVLDWRDPDLRTGAGVAETREYADRTYTPRNRGVGIGDPPLISGFGAEDFQPRIASGPTTVALFPSGLYSIVSPLPTGGGINPNHASTPVLESLGMTTERVERIQGTREQQPFRDREDFAERIGIDATSPLADAFVFDDGLAPAVSVLARVDGEREQYERRLYQILTQYRADTGLLESIRLLHTRHFYPFDPYQLEAR